MTTTTKQMEYNKHWRMKNKDKVTAAHKRWRHKNKDKVRAQKIRYYKKKYGSKYKLPDELIIIAKNKKIDIDNVLRNALIDAINKV